MKVAKVGRVYHDTPENVEMQKRIKARANYSLAILGMAFVHRASGRFVNLGLGPRPRVDAAKR